MARNWAEQAEESTYTYFQNGDLQVEDAVFCFDTNFTGAPTKVNPAGGKRTLNLALSAEAAGHLKDEGWNVRMRESSNPDEPPLYFTEIAINFLSKFPPEIVVINTSNKTKTRYDADMAGELDHMVIDRVKKLVVHPWEHGVANSAGSTKKGYLQFLEVIPQPPRYMDDEYEDYVWNN